MISVIVAVYNAEKYLERCIRSLINQTYKDIEILLINDGSTDRSLDICYKFAEDDPRIRVFTQENKGPAAARNVGLREMTGEYWTTLDSDDWLDNDAYEYMMTYINKFQVEMGIYGFRYTDGKNIWNPKEENRKTGIYHENECREFWLDLIYKSKESIMPFLWLRITKTSIVKEHHLFFDEDLRRSEDFYFLIRLHRYLKSMYVASDQKKLYYYQNPNSITHQYVKDYWKMVTHIYTGSLEELQTVKNIEEIKHRLNYMLIKRAKVALANEMKNSNGQREKYINIKRILNSPILRAATQEIEIRKMIQEFGKKSLLIKYRLAFLFMIVG